MLVDVVEIRLHLAAINNLVRRRADLFQHLHLMRETDFLRRRAGPDFVRHGIGIRFLPVMVKLGMNGIVGDGSGAPGDGIERGGIGHFKHGRHAVRPHAGMFALLDDADLVGDNLVGRGRFGLEQQERIGDLRAELRRAFDLEFRPRRGQRPKNEAGQNRRQREGQAGRKAAGLGLRHDRMVAGHGKKLKRTAHAVNAGRERETAYY